MKKQIFIILSLSLSICFGNPGLRRYIVQHDGAGGIGYLDYLPPSGSSSSPLPVRGGGSTFQLWALRADGQQWYLLATRYALTYNVSLSAILSSSDVVNSKRTRAGTPYYLNVTVSGLIGGEFGDTYVGLSHQANNGNSWGAVSGPWSLSNGIHNRTLGTTVNSGFEFWYIQGFPTSNDGATQTLFSDSMQVLPLHSITVGPFPPVNYTGDPSSFTEYRVLATSLYPNNRVIIRITRPDGTSVDTYDQSNVATINTSPGFNYINQSGAYNITVLQSSPLNNYAWEVLYNYSFNVVLTMNIRANINQK